MVIVRSFQSLRTCQLIRVKNFSTSQTKCQPVLLSTFYLPTCRRDQIAAQGLESVKVLLQGGYIRQSSSGIFTILPLGLRLLQKIEGIVDEELQKIGASKMELPSLLSSSLWQKTGRYETMSSELYKLQDRRGSKFLLAPTFEEEITKLVGDEIKSARDLPIKLYQTTKKYRDEPRPRNGLFRTREFLMNDLYTFDAGLAPAKMSYDEVQGAYHNIMTNLFGEYQKEWRLAEADTGLIGGSISHEYQVQDDAGEDTLFTCNKCSYAANSEMAKILPDYSRDSPIEADEVNVFLYGSHDPLAHGCTMTALVLPKERQRNENKIKKHLIEREKQALLPFKVSWDWKEKPEGPMIRYDRLKIVLDSHCRGVEVEEISQAVLKAINRFGSRSENVPRDDQERDDSPTLQDYFQGGETEAIITSIDDILEAQEGDRCVSCHDGELRESKAVEVAHTFLLGSRYSDTLGYKVRQIGESKTDASIQMGCYGIGISRIMGVLAQQASKKFNESNEGKGRGFRWNSRVAPFSALIMTSSNLQNGATIQAIDVVANSLQRSNNSICGEALHSSDIVIDDRKAYIASKFADADLVGYPVQCILGKGFEETGLVEVRQYTAEGLVTRQMSLEELK